MNKFLLLLLLGIAVYLILARAKRPPPATRKPEPPAVESMVRCAYCSVHLPQGESLPVDDKAYCCEEHRRLDQH